MRFKSGCCDDPLGDLVDSAVFDPPFRQRVRSVVGLRVRVGGGRGRTELCRAETLSREMPCAGRISLEEPYILVDTHHARQRFDFVKDHTKGACLYLTTS